MTAKSVAEKLLVKPGGTLWLSHPDRLGLIGALPDGVAAAGSLDGASVGLVFADSAADVRSVLDGQRASLGAAGVLWVLYPKANKADVNRDSLWPILGEYGLRPISQIAVDGTWSALRFRPVKPGEERFTGGA
jgi:hypothetical protein